MRNQSCEVKGGSDIENKRDGIPQIATIHYIEWPLLHIPSQSRKKLSKSKKLFKKFYHG